MRNVVIPSWYNRPGYVNALATQIMAKCDLSDDRTEPHVFFSAHGLPQKYTDEPSMPACLRACVPACLHA